MSIASSNEIFSESFPKTMQLTFSETGQSDIVLTNENICAEEMSLEEALFSTENIKYGSCESSCFIVKVVNSGSFVNKLLDVKMILKGVGNYLINDDGDRFVDADGNYLTYYNSNESTTVQVGKYKVFSDIPTNDRAWRTLVCYDAMRDILEANVATWYEGLITNNSFPMTIKAFRDSFFNYVGVTQETTTLIGDNLMIQNGFVSDGTLAGKTIIEAICELNGVFGHINRDGKFEYLSLPSSNEAITYSWYIDGTGEYEDYVTEKVTGIVARAESGDVGTTVGTTTNPYIIENNPLVYGLEGTTALTNHLTALLNKIKDVQFRPFTVETYGNPMLPLGTNIKLNVKRFTANGYQTFEINSFVMSKYMSGIQALKDKLTAKSEATQPSTVNSIQSQILRTQGKVHILRNTVDELYSEIYDASTGILSVISQLSNEIVLKVVHNSTTGIDKVYQTALDEAPTQGSEINISQDNISFITNGKIEMTSNALEINSTYFKVDSTGKITATSGDIGGWEINATRLRYIDPDNSNEYIQLNSSGKSIVVRKNNYAVSLSAGGLNFLYGDSSTGSVKGAYWTGTSSASNKRGASIMCSTRGGSYIDFGILDSSDTYAPHILINGGLNPNGTTEPIIMFEATRFYQDVYFDDAVHANEYIYVKSANDYINKSTWTIGSTTYHGLYLNRNVFTNGKVIAQDNIITEGIGISRMADALIDASSNNHVSGNNLYTGFAVYDNNMATRFCEFYGSALTTGETQGYVYVRNKKTDGTEVTNVLGCGVQKDGTLTYRIGSASAFRSALGLGSLATKSSVANADITAVDVTKVSNLGSIVNGTNADETILPSVWTTVNKITLTAGTWLVLTTVAFASNSNGFRSLGIGTDSSATGGWGYAHQADAAAANNRQTTLHNVSIFSPTASTTYYVNAYQDSGSNISTHPRMLAIRIK